MKAADKPEHAQAGEGVSLKEALAAYLADHDQEDMAEGPDLK